MRRFETGTISSTSRRRNGVPPLSTKGKLLPPHFVWNLTSPVRQRPIRERRQPLSSRRLRIHRTDFRQRSNRSGTSLVTLVTRTSGRYLPDPGGLPGYGNPNVKQVELEVRNFRDLLKVKKRQLVNVPIITL